MDKTKLCDALGARYYGAFWVRDLHLFDWGAQVVFDCLYEPGEPDAPVPFQIVLKDCRELQWRVYGHLRHPEDTTLPAALVNIRLGAGSHRRALNLLTDSFGLTALYGELLIRRSAEY